MASKMETLAQTKQGYRIYVQPRTADDGSRRAVNEDTYWAVVETPRGHIAIEAHRGYEEPELFEIHGPPSVVRAIARALYDLAPRRNPNTEGDGGGYP
jgi:hypothetical protein